MMKYTNDLLESAVKLDDITKSRGEVAKLATNIIESANDSSVIMLLRKLSSIVEDSSYTIDVKRLARIVKDNLYSYFGFLRISEICNKKLKEEDDRTLDELLGELNSLIGLENIITKVNNLIAYQKVQMLRRDNNLNIPLSTLHLAFTGNPGTGKTTVARIVGRIYKKIGLLSKGHFIEVSRTDLIAGYQGQTAIKVKKIVEQAKGGVLFIDEAYSITENDHSDSYGRECLTELTKALEDYRDDLVVIVAGYTEPMNRFFESNPGLKSRFNTFIEFKDYNSEELLKIVELMCTNDDYKLTSGVEDLIRVYFHQKIQDKEENFSNGRLARNLYDDLIMNHAIRILRTPNVNREDLIYICEDDFSIHT